MTSTLMIVARKETFGNAETSENSENDKNEDKDKNLEINLE